MEEVDLSIIIEQYCELFKFQNNPRIPIKLFRISLIRVECGKCCTGETTAAV
jgi:hypothetical protein